MFVRACCLSLLCLLPGSGCQTPAARFFPWTDDSSVTSLNGEELTRSRDEPTLSDEAFADRGQPLSGDSQLAPGFPSDNLRKQRSDRIDAWLQRGQNAILQAGNDAQSAAMLAEATHSFREALQLDPENADAFHGLAIVSDLNQDWESADYAYKRALAIRPNDVNLLNDQGYSYLLQDRYHEASQYLNRALQISPGHEKAHINLAILDIRRGHQDAALARLGQVYPAAKARHALAGLSEQYQPTASPANFGSQLTAGQYQQQPALTAGPGGPRNLPPPAGEPQFHPAQSNGVVTAQTPSQQSQYFNSAGVIQPQRSPTAVQPVAAAAHQMNSNRVFPAAVPQRVDPAPAHRHPTAAGSPLDSAQTVGGTFQIPPAQNLMRPQLPPSANVYNPDRVSQRDLAGTVRSAPQPAQMSSFNAGTQVPLQTQQPGSGYGQPPAQSYPPQQFHGQPAHSDSQTGRSGMTSDFQPPRNAPFFGQSAPASTGAGPQTYHTGFPNGSGQTPAGSQGQGFSVRADGQQPSGRFSATGRTQRTVVHSGGMAPAVSNVPDPSMTNPSAWPQSIPSQGTRAPTGGQQTHGIEGMPQLNTLAGHSNQTAPLAPQYFSPPPLMGHGYRDDSVSAPDPLAEYRETRQQLENEYNQTLQQIGQPMGERSYQQDRRMR